MPSESGMELEGDGDKCFVESAVAPGKRRRRGEEEKVRGYFGEAEEMEEHPGGNEDDLDSFIRVRNQSDGIFEQDEDEEDEEFYDFAIPEVEMGEATGSRKRKQDLFHPPGYDFSDIIEFTEPMVSSFHVEENEPERKRDKTPLYLLNPNNFGHDPKKQMQIRRAIITYRHHQEKKHQIIRLTEENTKLRVMFQSMRAKMFNMKNCGCGKNKCVEIPDIDSVIPVTPPKLYNRGPRSGDGTQVKTETESFSGPTIKTEDQFSSGSQVQSSQGPPVPKPLINISSSRFPNFNSKTLVTANVVKSSLPKQPLPRRLPLPNGTAALSSSQLVSNSGRVLNSRISITGSQAATKTGGFLPLSAVKPEPVDSPTSSASRIVFAKNGSTKNAVQTASQLFFKAKTPPTSLPSGSSLTGGFPQGLPAMNGLGLPKPNQMITASGKLVKLLQPQAAAALLQIPLPPGLPGKNVVPQGTPGNRPGLRRLVPKPSRQEEEQKRIEMLWKKAQQQDDDEMDIIAALNGSTPRTPVLLSNKRKQTLGGKIQKPPVNFVSQPKSTGLEDLQLNKYADIVFEEADEV